MQRIHVIDSHTGGEPTRVVVAGGPDLGPGTAAERLERLRLDYDGYRRAVVNEPRGSDVMVGALLIEPSDDGCAAGVIFFNNVGYLGMCGHGTIGLVATLAWMGRLAAGVHRIETPVGTVAARLHSDGRVSIENIPAYRLFADVQVNVPGYGPVGGDVAWGGNWFFLTDEHRFSLQFSEIEEMTRFSWAVRRALAEQGVTATGGAEIDHIELFGASDKAAIDSRNFVLCPGGAYDRSPCGTGTSAKLACLAARGELQPGEIWRQESIVGSVFEASYAWRGTDLIPTITGNAYVNGEADLILDPADPFCMGIAPA